MTTTKIRHDQITSEAETDGKVLTADGSGGAAWEAAAGGTGLIGWYDVTAYGATGDGTTDDTDAIDDAIAAMTAGGILWFPPGTYKSTGGHTISQPTIIMGAGSIGAAEDGAATGDVGAASQINCTSQTAVLFTVTADRSSFRDIALRNSYDGTPSAGSAIHVNGADAGQQIDFNHISVWGFYDDIDMQVGSSWKMEGCTILAPVRYGLRVRNTENGDAGDWLISNSHFYGALYDSTAAIRIESSGGAKIINTKFNAFWSTTYEFTNGIDLEPPAGTGTGQLMVSNCSFENIRENCIKVVTVATSQWHDLIFHGNQFGYYGVTDQNAINVTCANVNETKRVVIIGNVFYNNGSAIEAVSLTKVDNITIDDNVYNGFSALLSQTSCTNVKIGATLDDIPDPETGGGNPTFNIDGALAAASNVGAYICTASGSIQAVYIYCKTPGSASSTIVDVHLNGTTIFTTQGNRPTLAYNDADQVAKSGTPDVVTFAENDVLTVDIDQAATGAADLTVVIATTETAEGVWTDYSTTSTITGWSSLTTKRIYYKKIGKQVFISFQLEGTSDATSASFTVPSTSQSVLANDVCIRAEDNGSFQTNPGLLELASDDTVAHLYKNLAANAWTASGTKGANGQFFYTEA